MRELLSSPGVLFSQEQYLVPVSLGLLGNWQVCVAANSQHRHSCKAILLDLKSLQPL